MKSLDEIKNILREQKADLEKRFDILEIFVFGSYSRNEQNTNSDIDILVDFKESPGLLRFIALERELSDLLGSPVDLVTRKALKPRIGKQILSECIQI